MFSTERRGKHLPSSDYIRIVLSVIYSFIQLLVANSVGPEKSASEAIRKGCTVTIEQERRFAEQAKDRTEATKGRFIYLSYNIQFDFSTFTTDK